jgi:nucleotide-binding universal stress UspA family protein
MSVTGQRAAHHAQISRSPLLCQHGLSAPSPVVFATPNPSGEILFATDFREGAGRALAFVKQAAKHRHLRVRIVHVLELTEDRESFLADQVEAKRMLRQAGHELRLAGLVETATLITAGQAGPAISEAAERYCPALLVMVLRSHAGRGHNVFGKTGSSLLRRAGCPVCIVGPRSAEDCDLTRPTLFATDLEPQSLRLSLDAWPVSLQRRKVWTVLPPAQKPDSAQNFGPRPLSDFRNHDDDQLEPARALSRESAAQHILSEAAQSPPALIVLGFARSGYLDSLAGGGFIDSIVRDAPCPVLLVRAPAPAAS